MKKIFILLVVLGFFVEACNNNKTAKIQNSNNREKDDYSKSENRDKEEKTTSEETTVSKANDNNAMLSSWSSNDINEFVSNCVSTAVQGGMSQELSEKYCSCIQQKIEQLYPDPKDAGNITDEQMNSPSMKSMVRGCLTGN